MGNLMTNPFFLLAIVVLFSFLMVSEIPFFSLKVKSLKFKENKHLYLVALFAIIKVAIFGLAAIPFVMLFYIIVAMFVKPTK
jgi:CDP-diacylglycerol--serine O-phosphatidyltransferase